MKRLLVAVSASLSAVLFTALPAFAAVTVINNPDAAYLSSTGKCDPGPEFSVTTTCVDALGLTAHFSSPVTVLHQGTSWATWSSPPFSESPSPKLVFATGSSLTIDESDVISPTAGVEMEPNIFATFTMSASFYDYQGGLIATVTRSVNGFAGARLFAINSDEAVVASIVTSCSGGCGGYGIAQIRATDFTTSASTATAPSGSYAGSGGGNS